MRDVTDDARGRARSSARASRDDVDAVARASTGRRFAGGGYTRVVTRGMVCGYTRVVTRGMVCGYTRVVTRGRDVSPVRHPRVGAGARARDAPGLERIVGRCWYCYTRERSRG